MSRKSAKRQRFCAECKRWRAMLRRGLAVEVRLPLRPGTTQFWIEP